MTLLVWIGVQGLVGVDKRDCATRGSAGKKYFFLLSQTHRRPLSLSLSLSLHVEISFLVPLSSLEEVRLRGPLLEYTSFPLPIGSHPFCKGLERVAYPSSWCGHHLPLPLHCGRLAYLPPSWWIGLFCTLIPTLCELMVFYRVLALKVQ